jgi:LCP family protein required for cell wall assembly
VRRVLVGLLAVVVALVGGLFAFGWWQFSKIERVDVAKVLSPQAGAGTNYLVVGTDTREGISKDDPNAGAFLGGPAEGTRTDTIMVLRVEGSRSTLLSIPRDLWVKNPKTGEFGRINSVFRDGPAELIRAVQGLGIPVHHYLEVNFVSFAGLVDAVGGIDVNFPHPTRDRNSGLDIPTAGVHRLDGVQGLAYVRSRHHEQLIDGRWQEDPTADLGRVQRQRTFLASLVSGIGGTRNPLTLTRLASSLSGGVRIDNTLTYFDALGLAWKFRSFNPETRTLPVVDRGDRATLKLTAEAPGVIAQFQ